MKLLTQHKLAIDKVIKFIQFGEFYLAGGTAVFYYLQHRQSLDLDFFTQKQFDFIHHLHYLAKCTILYQSSNTIHINCENTKISFFYYPYPLLKPTTALENIYLAHLEDVLCMKISAIINRGSKKDFTDAYFILQHLIYPPSVCIDLFQKKYGQYNPFVIHKALTYFADADNEPDLKMIQPIKWNQIKKFFLTEFSKF